MTQKRRIMRWFRTIKQSRSPPVTFSYSWGWKRLWNDPISSMMNDFALSREEPDIIAHGIQTLLDRLDGCLKVMIDHLWGQSFDHSWKNVLSAFLLVSKKLSLSPKRKVKSCSDMLQENWCPVTQGWPTWMNLVPSDSRGFKVSTGTIYLSMRLIFWQQREKYQNILNHPYTLPEDDKQIHIMSH